MLRLVKNKVVPNCRKPLAIHVEALHLRQVQKALLSYLQKLHYKPKLYCLTPINQLYVEAFFGPVNKSYEEELSLAYQTLVSLGYKLQLHIHLTRIPNQLSFHVKQGMIEEAYDWLSRFGKPTELVLGWFAEEEGVPKLAAILGLKLLGMQEFLRKYRVIHDYNLVGAK